MNEEIWEFFKNNMELIISGFALLISIVTIIYTFLKNRDLTHVIFNKPVYILSQEDDKPENEEEGAASKDETHFKTAIEIINASNHNRGYFDFQLKLKHGNVTIRPKNKHNNTAGNVDARSHQTLLFEGKVNHYIESKDDFKIILSVKLVKRRLFPMKMYKEKQKEINRIFWGDVPRYALTSTHPLDKPSFFRKIRYKIKKLL